MNRFTGWLVELANKREGWISTVATRLLDWRNTWRWNLTVRYPYLLRNERDKLLLAWSLGPFVYYNVWRGFNIRYRMLRAEYGGRVKKGRLEAFCETGTEGLVWELNEDGKTGYESLAGIEAGDRLLIFHHNGTVAFDGEIDPDYEIGKQPAPMNPKYLQPVAFGCWIHWTQRGWEPEEWAALFFHGDIITEYHPFLSRDTDCVPLRAIVVKKDAASAEDS